MQLLGLDLPAPDHTTISHCSAKLTPSPRAALFIDAACRTSSGCVPDRGAGQMTPIVEF
jgi:hypothetical protein